MMPGGWLLVAWCAAQGPGDVDQDRVDGSPRVDAVAGHGGLTAGMASDGTVTVLRWPTPLGQDHLHHVTASAPRGEQPHPSTLPRAGAAATDGLQVGVFVETDTEARAYLLSDPLFTRQLAYASDVSRVMQLTARSPLVDATLDVWVSSLQDVLRMHLTLAPGARVRTLRAFVVVHPALCPAAAAYLPTQDVLGDLPGAGVQNGFAGLAVPQRRAVLSVQPFPALRRRALQALGPWLNQPESGLEALEALEPLAAVTLALAADRPATLQVGASDDGKGVLLPRDAFADVADGALSGHPLHVGDHTLALMTDLPSGGTSDVTFVVALSQRPSAALDLLGQVLTVPHPVARAEADRAISELARTVALPTTDDPFPRAAALRSVSVLLQNQAASGAVAVAPNTQPMVGVDRQVEAAVVDLALVAASLTRRAVAHRAFWAAQQREAAEEGAPEGTAAPAVHADGLPATLLPWALDSLAVGLWADALLPERILANVAGNPATAVNAVVRSVPAAARTLLFCAESPAACVTGSWLGPTDGASLWTDATVVAALGVLPALLAASGQGELVDRTDAAWVSRHAALGRRVQAEAADAPLVALGWALGPAGALLDRDEDDAARRAAVETLLSRLEATLQGDAPEALVRALPLCAWLALWATQGDRSAQARARSIVDRVLEQAVSPQGHVALSVLPVPGSGAGVASLAPRNGTPSTLAHAALYLALLERHGRSPPTALPVPPLPVPGSGCDCAAAGDANVGEAGALALLGVAMRRVNRRRKRLHGFFAAWAARR